MGHALSPTRASSFFPGGVSVKRTAREAKDPAWLRQASRGRPSFLVREGTRARQKAHRALSRRHFTGLKPGERLESTADGRARKRARATRQLDHRALFEKEKATAAMTYSPTLGQARLWQ